MHVARIAITPVKGLGLNHPESVLVTAAGVPGDRRYAMVDTRDRMVNGKRLGQLVRVHAHAADDPESLALVLPDGSQVHGPVELGGSVDAVFYGEVRPARVVLGEFSEVLSELAGEHLRLVRLPDGEAIDRRRTGVVSLQSIASLEALGREAGGDAAVDGRRFRMTFTIDGAAEHAEDAWIGVPVRIGEAVIVPEGNIGRCAVTTQNPETGVPDLDTLKTLANYRGGLDATEKLPFGVHASVIVPGRVGVGDPITLVA